MSKAIMNELEKFIFGEKMFDRLPNEEQFKNKIIMITGAAGSIANEIISQLFEFEVKRIILFDHNDSQLIETYRKFNKNQSIDVIPILGDILDLNLINQIMQQYVPDIVIHSAAYKIVPLCETNPITAIQNNLVATMNIFKIAGELKIPKVIFISSNEAYKAQNVFGFTKKIAELGMTYYSKIYPSTEYKAIRFGFVLFSQGSVAEIFGYQAQKNEDLTVTDPQVTKYICSISEAACASLSLLDVGKSGEVITFDMGQPIKLTDLAEKFINYYNSKSKITYIGLRPGDKLTEPLTGGENGLINTEVLRLFVTNITEVDKKAFEKRYNSLENLLLTYDSKLVLNELRKMSEW